MPPQREPISSLPYDSRLGLALLGVAIGLGLFWLWPVLSQNPPLALDEHASFWMQQDGFPERFLQRTLNIAAVPPASGVLEHLSLTVLGQSENALRLPSAMCYLAAVALMFGYCRLLGSAKLAGVASLLLACHPDVVDEVRIARPYGLVLLLSVGLLWITLQWTLQAGSWRNALAWGLCAAALMWTHYTTLPLIVCSAGLLAASVAKRRKIEHREWLTLLLAFVLGAGLCLPLWPSLQRLREWSPFLNFAPVASPAWKSIGIWWWMTAAAAVVGSLKFLMTRRDESPQKPGLWWICAGMSLAPLVLLAILGEGDALLASPRYRVALAPASVALCASVLWWPRRWLLSVLTLVMLCAACWIAAPRSPWQLGRLADPASYDWKQLAEMLQQQGHDGEVVFVQGGLVESSLMPALFSDDEFSGYIASRLSSFYLPRPLVRKGLPFLWNSAPMQAYYEKLLREDEQGNPRRACWIAVATDTDLNRLSGDGILKLAEQNGYKVAETRAWPNARLVRLEKK